MTNHLETDSLHVPLDVLNEQSKFSNYIFRVLNESYKSQKHGVHAQYIQHLQEQCQIAIEETDILKIIYWHIVMLETEKMKVDIRIENLTEENTWLRHEINHFLEWNHTVERKVETEIAMKTNFKNRYIQLTYRNEENEEQRVEDMGNLLNSFDFNLTELVNDVHVSSQLRPTMNLLVEYSNQGRVELAVGLCKSAIGDQNNKGKQESMEFAVLLCILAVLYQSQEKLDEAAAALGMALKLLTKLNANGTPQYLAVLNNLVLIYDKMKRFKDAERYCKAALDLKRKQCSADDPILAHYLHNLGRLQLKSKLKPGLEELFVEAIRIYQLHSSKYRTDLIDTKNNLASYYMKAGKLDEAETTLLQTINIMVETNQLLCANKSSSGKNIVFLIHAMKKDPAPGSGNGRAPAAVGGENYVKYFTVTGPYPHLFYKNTFLLLEGIYQTRRAQDLVTMIEEYIYWCIFGHASSSHQTRDNTSSDTERGSVSIKVIKDAKTVAPEKEKRKGMLTFLRRNK